MSIQEKVTAVFLCIFKEPNHLKFVKSNVGFILNAY